MSAFARPAAAPRAAEPSGPATPQYSTPGSSAASSVAALNTRPEWQPDHEAPNCTECHCQWSLFNRRHHCRGCGRVYCGECTAQEIDFPPEYNYPKGPQRVCLNCYLILFAQRHIRDGTTPPATGIPVEATLEPEASEGVAVPADQLSGVAVSPSTSPALSTPPSSSAWKGKLVLALKKDMATDHLAQPRSPDTARRVEEPHQQQQESPAGGQAQQQ
eukprot:m51a1_g9509 putative zinc finger fyve domain-containing protein 16 (217) ;mRNA; r:690567-691606